MATVMPSGASFASVGIIETQTDVDVFAFRTEAGTIQLDGFPDSRSPNLDILLVLYDANGSRIAESNPETALSASISLLVPAGTYYLEIRPSGHGDPFFDGYSSSASLGTYVLAGQMPYVDVANDPALFIRIGELNLSVVRSARWNAVLSRVTITDLNGLAVPGATVSGIWGLLATGTISGITSSDGSVSFTSARLKGSGDVSFQVTGVTAPGLTYSPADDVGSSAVIRVGSQP